MSLEEDLLTDLIRDEGERFVVYDDATGKPLVAGMTLVGKPTISIGVNLTDVPLTPVESRALAKGRIEKSIYAAVEQWPWIEEAPEAVQRGIFNMVYNMGLGGVARFHDMLTALQARDYLGAATAALDSAWARQVGDRATRIADLFRSAHQGATT